jgi:hypothetical protein
MSEDSERHAMMSSTTAANSGTVTVTATDTVTEYLF